MPNRLANESSPYLLQHSHNPVNWYPWCDEAFETAAREDKLVFLSIGYSTCHWCHVMEKESFEDVEIAELMNKYFISIKVDREERPDIDDIYMSVAYMLNKSGGWPLTIILQPDKKPFFAGTYFPKESIHGRVGLKDLIYRVQFLWLNNRDSLNHTADEITKQLQNEAFSASENEISNECYDILIGNLKDSFDKINGGFGKAPKFPMAHNLNFLLNYHYDKKDTNYLEMVETTLQKMSSGGIYDHLGFGFHRYSTDEKWLLPHFEKMLYDQALLLMNYADCYQITKKTIYKKIAEEIIQYVTNDLLSPTNGFYSAEDADSEGVEGKFYLWEQKESNKILGEDAVLFNKLFNVHIIGNFQTHFEKNRSQNILHLVHDEKYLAGQYGISEEFLNNFIETSKNKLKEYRSQRVRPSLDDKILTDWNGLMIAALAKAGTNLNNVQYLEYAEKAAEFFTNEMTTPDNGLWHRWRNGNKGIEGFLDDYVFFVWGLLELYNATFKVKYLQKAIQLTQYTFEHFEDTENGGFFHTSVLAEKLIVRKKEVFENAIPTGNAVHLANLIKLYKITGEKKYLSAADKSVKAFAGQVSQNPMYCTQFLTNLLLLNDKNEEIVIVGDIHTTDTLKIIDGLRNDYNPFRTIVFKSINNDEFDIQPFAEYSKTMSMKNNSATVYRCTNFTCSEPVNEVSGQMSLF